MLRGSWKPPRWKSFLGPGMEQEQEPGGECNRATMGEQEQEPGGECNCAAMWEQEPGGECNCGAMCGGEHVLSCSSIQSTSCCLGCVKCPTFRSVHLHLHLLLLEDVYEVCVNYIC